MHINKKNTVMSSRLERAVNYNFYPKFRLLLDQILANDSYHKYVEVVGF